MNEFRTQAVTLRMLLKELPDIGLAREDLSWLNYHRSSDYYYIVEMDYTVLNRFGVTEHPY